MLRIFLQYLACCRIEFDFELLPIASFKIGLANLLGVYMKVSDVLAANQSRFIFSATTLGKLGVYSFNGHEQVNQPYKFDIELVSRSSNLSLNSCLGSEATLEVYDDSGGVRFINGVIMQMEQLHTANTFTHYSCILVPRFWFLSETQNHKIFQNKTVPQIIEEVLHGHGFSDESYSFHLAYKYPKREYCVQYAESDLSFITRLCEEEAIYIYFTHEKHSHCICFSDHTPGSPLITGNSEVIYHRGSGTVADTATISRWRTGQKIQSNKVQYREWNFSAPFLDLTSSISEHDPKKAPVPTGMNMERYQFPHLYQTTEEGKRYAEIEIQRQLTFQHWGVAVSNISRFNPGCIFTLTKHPRREDNRRWWIYSVSHQGEQPGVLEHEAPDDRGLLYYSESKVLPDDIRFVPPIAHRKKRIKGVQSAIVTGPASEEIYTDEYGRVKVQFHWDRLGRHDANTTCWVRVAQGWAGTGYGMLAIPRIGHEVFVEFLEGDPDRPVITGRGYHKENKVPYALPENKTRTIFKSMSTPGEDGVPRGFNELRIEDKAGSEEVYIHAQKDVNTLTENDWKDVINNDRHQTVKRNTYVQTDGETHETLIGARKTELHSNDNTTVHGDSHAHYQGKWLAKSDDEIHFKAGIKAVVEAGMEMTLKVGSSFIKITPAGIKLNGPSINLNGSGAAAGAGTGASPLLPADAEPVERSLAPVSMSCSCRLAAGKPFIEIG